MTILSRATNACLLCFLFCTSPANAIPITFTATDFSLGAPQAIVTGSFDYSFDAADNFVLNDFNMDILDKTYSLADISFIPDFGTPGLVILGANGPPDGITAMTDDFWLFYDTVSMTSFQFFYSVSGRNATWSSANIVVDARSVPEPATALLIILSLLGVRLARKNDLS